MPKCSYCGEMYEMHEGLTYVLKDGKIKHLCSSKCRKNMKMGRNSEDVNWVRKKKQEQEKEVKEELIKEAEEKKEEAGKK